MFAGSTRRVLPGFTLSLGTSLLFVCLILLLPLSALVMQLAEMSWSQYWEVVTNPQVVAAYKVTLLSAFVASIFNGVFGLLMAWILTRYRFPGRTLLDALMDLPFALPTAVAGLTLASLFSVNGFYGEWLAKFDIKVTYTARYRGGDGLYQHPVCGAYRAAGAGRVRTRIRRGRGNHWAPRAGRVSVRLFCRNFLRPCWRGWRSPLPAASVNLARSFLSPGTSRGKPK